MIKSFITKNLMSVVGVAVIALLLALVTQTARVSSITKKLAVAEAQVNGAAEAIEAYKTAQDETGVVLDGCLQHVADIVSQREADQAKVQKELTDREIKFNQLQRVLTDERKARAILWKESVDCETFAETHIGAVCPAVFERLRERSMRAGGDHQDGGEGNTG